MSYYAAVQVPLQVVLTGRGCPGGDSDTKSHTIIRYIHILFQLVAAVPLFGHEVKAGKGAVV